jgi:prepilin-type N-terminal cleavage/methylation domain-containing protein
MKKKGFTLLELLTVIMVLAIILLIVVPVINGIIENSKKSAAVASAYNYFRAIDTELSNQKTSFDQTASDKKIEVGEHKVEYFDNKIEVLNSPDRGDITIDSSNRVIGACLEIFGYRVDYDGDKAIVNENSTSCSDVELCLDIECIEYDDTPIVLPELEPECTGEDCGSGPGGIVIVPSETIPEEEIPDSGGNVVGCLVFQSAVEIKGAEFF